MKLIFFVLFTVLFVGTLSLTCTEDRQIDCVDDIRNAVPVCQQAAQKGGADTAADLDCIKYFASIKADCWACICWVAELDGIKIKGC